MNIQPVIAVHSLKKTYDKVEAVKGIDFQVSSGEVFGLLGPNGAGKTSTIEILEGLRPRTGGEATVLGFDPDRQKQRLALALALVNDPQLLFLDEPTTGLDPQIRLEIHGLIEEMKAEKRTVVLTTHYIEEAERLCDRVAIMDEGKIVAMGTPRELKQRSKAQSLIQIVCEQPLRGENLPAWPDAVETRLNGDGRELLVYSNRPARTLTEIIKWLDQQGIQLEDVHLKRPTLEDVFVELTGKKLRD